MLEDITKLEAQLGGNIQEQWLEKLTSKSYSHLPTYYVKGENMREETQLLGGKSNSTSVLLKNWHTAPSGGSKQVLYPPLCTTQILNVHHCTAISSWHRQTQSINISSKSFFKTSVIRRQEESLVIDYLATIWILPQHRTQTSDCPSCGDTWAWRQVRWGGRRPDRGHLS